MANAIFLFSELSQYFLGSLSSVQVDGDEIQVVHWPINSEAPFSFVFPTKIRFIQKSFFFESNPQTELLKLAPSLIFVSGWMDKDYLRQIKAYKTIHPNTNVVMGMDNPWKGTLKQHLSRLYFRLSLKRYIDFVWVPGERQVRFARMLGYPAQNIFKGFYSADVNTFSKAWQAEVFTPRLIFAGRYVKEKGLLELLDAFEKVSPQGWELICIGTGPLKDGLKEIPGVKHLGFVQPNDLPEVMKGGGIFVLPSHFEPWGVVVHEFAAAGFPLLLSDQVGAAEAFLEEGVNGFLFSHAKKGDLEEKIRQMTSMPIAQLKEMSRKSNEFAQRITPEKWASTLNELLHVRH